MMNTKKSTEFSCFQINHKNLFKRNALVLFLCLSKSWMKSNRGSFLEESPTDPFYSISQNQRMVRVGRELKDHPASTEIYWYNYVTKSKRKLRSPFKSLISGKVFNDNWSSGIDFRKLSLVPVNKQGSSFSYTNSSQLRLRGKLYNNITGVY